jgi:ribosomal-protein-alanine N-acetyltransferase
MNMTDIAKTRTAVDIRWMIRRDLNPAVLDIERRCFHAPWSEEDFLNCLRQITVIGMVADLNPDRMKGTPHVAGFMVYELSRRAIEIRNFAVHPEFQRTGIGAQMIERLVTKLSQQRRQSLLANVRESNTAAHLFFRAMGFCACDVLRGHYEDTGEAAYRFEYLLDESP